MKFSFSMYKAEYVTYDYLTNAYAINTSGKFVWLQRLAYRILKKFGRVHKDSSVRYYQGTINTDDIVRAINESRANIYAITGKQAKYIVLGTDAYYNLVKTMDEYPPTFITFDYPRGLEFGRAPGQYERIDGLRIVVVPWINGFYLLPDLENYHG